MRMLNDNVLVREFTANDTSEGGIIIPEKARKKTASGTVISVGPGLKLEDGSRFLLDLQIGDVVFYPQNVGDIVEVSGIEYRCIPERYICGVIADCDIVMEEEGLCCEELS